MDSSGLRVLIDHAASVPDAARRVGLVLRLAERSRSTRLLEVAGLADDFTLGRRNLRARRHARSRPWSQVWATGAIGNAHPT